MKTKNVMLIGLQFNTYGTINGHLLLLLLSLRYIFLTHVHNKKETRYYTKNILGKFY